MHTREKLRIVYTYFAFIPVFQIGYQLPSQLDVEVVGHQYGPSIVVLRFDTPFGRIVFLETILPLRPMLQQVRHCAYAYWTVPRLLTAAFLRSAIVQFERDVSAARIFHLVINFRLGCH